MKKLILIICLFLFSNCLAISGDTNGDQVVDVTDLVAFANQWLSTGNCDFNNDGIVNWRDFATMAANWGGGLHGQPGQATNPDPANSATGINLNKVLTWTASDSESYDIYFGTVNPPPFVCNQKPASFSVTKNFSTMYYWKINNRNRNGTAIGDVWNFTTAANQVPTASDISKSTNAYIVTPITLLGNDEGQPNPPGKLKYVITQLPNDNGAYVQDPVSGGQAQIRTADLPYKLSSWGKIINFATSSTATDTIKYKAFDGLDYSAEKTITLTVSANPQDCISLDGSGTVTVTSNANFNLIDKRGIALYVQTRALTGTLCSKYTPGSAGYVFSLVAGFPTLNLYSSSGLVSSVRHSRRINDGYWHNVGFCYDAVGFAQTMDANETEAAGFNLVITDWKPVTVIDYTNTSDFIIGSYYKWNIDNVRIYSLTSYTDNYYSYYALVCGSRANAGTDNTWGGITIEPGAIIRFKCNYDGVNNTSTQIYDDLSNHYIGNFSSSHVKYLPFYWHWYDSAAFQQVSR